MAADPPRPVPRTALSRIGSLLLPFSNLTNLVLVSATGLGLAAYVGLAVWPRLAAALAVGVLFAVRARRPIADLANDGDSHQEDATGAPGSRASDEAAAVAGGVVVVGAFAAVGVGLAGGDMALPFAMSAGLLAGVAVTSGRLDRIDKGPDRGPPPPTGLRRRCGSTSAAGELCPCQASTVNGRIMSLSSCSTMWQ
jgi:Na+/H+ antiporter NhaD/arsenite permease-like protein